MKKFFSNVVHAAAGELPRRRRKKRSCVSLYTEGMIV